MGPDRYIRKLVSAGHKVGVVSQTETAAEKKVNKGGGGGGGGGGACFERHLTAVYTCTTLMGLSGSGHGDDNRYVLSCFVFTTYVLSSQTFFLIVTRRSGWIVTLLQDHGEIGLAGCHPLAGKVIYDMFTAEDANLEQRLVLIQPTEVLICSDQSLDVKIR